MSQGNHNQANRSALVVLADTKLTAQGEQLAQLQKSAVAALQAVPQMERQAAAHAILAGMTLHRVKASLPHGSWEPWVNQIGTSGADLKKVSLTQVKHYMRLATVFIGKAKVTAPDVLALPGDQTQLLLEGGEGEARAFFGKLSKFVGTKSLNELLSEHQIKGAKKLGGKREAAESDEPTDTPPVPTAEELAAQTRTELAEWIEHGRQLLIHDNVCSRLAGADVRAFASALDSMLKHWRRGSAAILAGADEPEVVGSEPVTAGTDGDSITHATVSTES